MENMKPPDEPACLPMMPVSPATLQHNPAARIAPPVAEYVAPEVATLNGIQGRVYVIFIVEKDGSVTNGKVVKGVDPLINDEALKAVMSSPKWTPGKQRGTAVRVSYIIMLNFQL